MLGRTGPFLAKGSSVKETATTTQLIYYSPATQPIVFGSAATAWATSTGYVVGNRVTNGGSTYFCLVAHTSGTFATDLAAGDWILVTPIVWTPGTTPLAITKTRISAVWDRGAGDLPSIYRWRASTRWAATVTAGDALKLYLPTSYGSATAALADQLQTFGDADLAATSDVMSLGGVQSIGNIVAATATDQLWLNSGLVEIYSRYVALAAYNAATAKALTSTASDHWVLLTAIPPVIEAAA